MAYFRTACRSIRCCAASCDSNLEVSLLRVSFQVLSFFNSPSTGSRFLRPAIDLFSVRQEAANEECAFEPHMAMRMWACLRCLVHEGGRTGTRKGTTWQQSKALAEGKVKLRELFLSWYRSVFRELPFLCWYSRECQATPPVSCFPSKTRHTQIGFASLPGYTRALGFDPVLEDASAILSNLAHCRPVPNVAAFSTSGGASFFPAFFARVPSKTQLPKKVPVFAHATAQPEKKTGVTMVR